MRNANEMRAIAEKVLTEIKTAKLERAKKYIEEIIEPSIEEFANMGVMSVEVNLPNDIEKNLIIDELSNAGYVVKVICNNTVEITW
jgi:D-aminopeptidase